MKKMSIFIISLLLLLPSTAFAAKPTPTPSPKIICVDAGHGGTDTGATYKDITEAQETWDIAQRLQTLLSNAGYSVVPTRTSPDQDPSNTDRANTCNTAGAAYLVSIHLNGSTNHAIDYTGGLYGKPLKDKAWAQKINTAMSALGIANHGITNFADGMLLKANMPATIAETVFISSDAEYALLTGGETRQQQIAQALFTGITSQ